MNKQTPTQLPYTFSNIIQQLGGTGINGAFAYTGGRNRAYHAGEGTDNGAYPLKMSSVKDNGTISADSYLQWDVNVKRGQVWRVIVAYEPNDTYTVRLWRMFGAQKMFKTGKVGEVLYEFGEVYCDNLKSVVESTYDQAINKYNNGFINL